MTTKLILRGKEYEVKSGTTVRHALEKIGVNSEAVLATRNGELLTDDEIVNEGDIIKLVAVISGGSGNPPTPSLPRRHYRKLVRLRRITPQTYQFPNFSPFPEGRGRGDGGDNQFSERHL